MKKWKEILPGFLFCILLSIPAWFLGRVFPIIGGPVFAILISMFLAFLVHISKKPKEESLRVLNPGCAYTSKKILQFAVILLGFGLNLKEIVVVGQQSLLLIFSSISVALIVSFILQKVLKIPAKTATMVGVGSSICGGSAIAAVAPVIRAEDEEIAQSISVIFLFNVIAAIIFPSLGRVLHMTDQGFGMFAGTAVNDTSSVTAAASSWDHMFHGSALQMATIVKLTRTLAIIPISFVLAILETRRMEEAEEKSGHPRVSLMKIFPWFILYFVLASVVTTIFPIPAVVVHTLKDLSKYCIILAMCSIGWKTNIVHLVKTGGKPILQGLICWISIILVSLGVQSLLHLW